MAKPGDVVAESGVGKAQPGLVESLQVDVEAHPLVFRCSMESSTFSSDEND